MFLSAGVVLNLGSTAVSTPRVSVRVRKRTARRLESAGAKKQYPVGAVELLEVLGCGGYVFTYVSSWRHALSVAIWSVGMGGVD